jgi:hypothetical protein
MKKRRWQKSEAQKKREAKKGLREISSRPSKSLVLDTLKL